MKEIVECLRVKNYLFKKLVMIDTKALQTRKKIAVYEGVDFESNYAAIFSLKQKSRFLRKDADVIELLYDRLKVLQDHNYKKKILLYDMPFCSKAQKQMKEAGWRLINAAV